MRTFVPDGSTRVFDLEQPRFMGMPVHPAHRQAGYSYLLHRHHEDEYRPDEHGPRTGAAGIIICGEHTGTHIDALCHQSDDLVLYGGIAVDGRTQTSRGFTRLGVEEIPPILAPGVLLDVAASKGVEVLEPGYATTDRDLEECCERHGVSVEPGDVALVRTGNARYWNEQDRYLAGPGWPRAPRTGSPKGACSPWGRTTWPGTRRGCATPSWARCRGT